MDLGEEVSSEDESGDLDNATLYGKLAASKASVIEKYGEAYVNQHLIEPGSPLALLEQKDPTIIQRIQGHDHPYQEAIRVLEENKIFETYGRDLQTVEKKIVEKIRPGLVEEIRKELTNELKGNIKDAKEQVNGVRESRTVASDAKKVEKDVFDEVFA
jgi:hypothetical protein